MTHDAAGEVFIPDMIGLDVAAVLLPSDLSLEDRVSRMKNVWQRLGERKALVVAVSASEER